MTRRDLTDFLGHWSLDRHVTPFDGQPEATATGRARFEATDTGLIYRETLDLVIAGHAPVRAERSYLWRAVEAAIAVDFSDGRPFHSFEPNGRSEAAHWCDPDQYDVAYDFEDWPDWTSTWRVKGPRKDYAMVTRYVPFKA